MQTTMAIPQLTDTSRKEVLETGNRSASKFLFRIHFAGKFFSSAWNFHLYAFHIFTKSTSSAREKALIHFSKGKPVSDAGQVLPSLRFLSFSLSHRLHSPQSSRPSPLSQRLSKSKFRLCSRYLIIGYCYCLSDHIRCRTDPQLSPRIIYYSGNAFFDVVCCRASLRQFAGLERAESKGMRIEPDSSGPPSTAVRHKTESSTL